MEPPAAKLRRHEDKAAYDLDSASKIFSDCFMAHVSYVDKELPHCLPMIALLTQLEGEPAVYLHGHPSSRLMELVRQRTTRDEDKSEEEIEEGKIRVCVTATKVDGLVLSDAPNGHAFNYRSSVVHGSCSLVKEKEIKKEVMRAVTNHIVAGRWEQVHPVASFQVSLVTVIRVRINGLSTKKRTGVPRIQPRNVEKDGPNRVESPWTGVVPVYDTLAGPVPSGLTDDAIVPDELNTFIQERNQKHKDYSFSTTK